MLRAWLGPDSAAPILAAATAGDPAAADRGRHRRTRQLPDARSARSLAAALLIPLLSPQGWDYVFLIGTPAVMLLVNETAIAAARAGRRDDPGDRGRGPEHFDLMGRSAYSLFMGLSLITVFVVIEVAALITLRFRRAA